MQLNEHQTLYVEALSKLVQVTAMFTDVNAANAYMETHPDEGVIQEIKPFIFLARTNDLGVKLMPGQRKAQ